MFDTKLKKKEKIGACECGREQMTALRSWGFVLGLFPLGSFSRPVLCHSLFFLWLYKELWDGDLVVYKKGGLIDWWKCIKGG